MEPVRESLNDTELRPGAIIQDPKKRLNKETHVIPELVQYRGDTLGLEPFSGRPGKEPEKAPSREQTPPLVLDQGKDIERSR